MKKYFTNLVFLMLLSMFSFAQKEQALNNFFSGKIFENESFSKSFFHGDDSPQPASNKLMNTIKHRLDSVLISNIGDSEKEVLTYDSHGNCILSVRYTKDDYTDDCKNSYKTEYAFDIFGNRTSKISSRWLDEENRWRFSSKRKYVYNGQGTGMTIYGYKWNDDLGAWRILWKGVHLTDSQGNTLSVYDYHWNNIEEKWYESNKTTFLYQDLYTMQYTFRWNSELNTWYSHSYVAYGYDDYGNLISYNYKEYMDDIPTNKRKKDYTNDENGNLIELITYDWNIETNQWVEFEKVGFQYDSYQNTTQLIGYTWNDEAMDWAPETKANFTFNNDIPFDEILWPYEDEEMIKLVSMPVSMTEVYVDTNNNWVDGGRADLYYSEDVYDYIEEEKLQDIQLFPNPVSSQFSLHIPDSYLQVQFELFDLQGRVIMKKDVTNKENINIENLKPGVYIYSISFDGKTQRGKLINK